MARAPTQRDHDRPDGYQGQQQGGEMIRLSEQMQQACAEWTAARVVRVRERALRNKQEGN